MSRLTRRWKLMLPLGVLAIAASVVVSTSLAASDAAAGEIRVAIMTDCKGAFGFGYEIGHRRRPGGVRAVRGRQGEEPEEAVRRA